LSTVTTSVRKHPSLLIGLAYAAFISLGLPDGLTGVAWPSIRTTFGLPLDALGALITTGTIGYLAASFSSGRILARIGVGWLLVLSCLATAVSLLGYSMSPLWALMVALGLMAGLGAAAAFGRSISSLLYGVTPYDRATYVAVPILLLTIAAIACVFPALRAARIDPVRMLRN